MIPGRLPGHPSAFIRTPIVYQDTHNSRQPRNVYQDTHNSRQPRKTIRTRMIAGGSAKQMPKFTAADSASNTVS